MRTETCALAYVDGCAYVRQCRCDCICDLSVGDSVRNRWHFSTASADIRVNVSVNMSLNVSLNANLHTA